MVAPISTALTGLNAASTRLSVAANNIANQNSTRKVVEGQEVAEPFTPQEVVQTSQDNGGVSVQVRNSTVEPVKVFNPNNPDADEKGFVAVPNIDLERQVVDVKLAVYDFKAGLKVIDVQDEIAESTLDILT